MLGQPRDGGVPALSATGDDGRSKPEAKDRSGSLQAAIASIVRLVSIAPSGVAWLEAPPPGRGALPIECLSAAWLLCDPLLAVWRIAQCATNSPLVVRAEALCK